MKIDQKIVEATVGLQEGLESTKNIIYMQSYCFSALHVNTRNEKKILLHCTGLARLLVRPICTA